MLVIKPPITQDELAAVRGLMRSFVAWHRRRHRADLALINQYFDEGAYELELSSLPGKYAPPGGTLLLATLNNHPVGCVALRALDVYACEMKRMFVDPRYQGKGIGRALAENVIHEARMIGYSSIVLDTSVRQIEALNLYESLGFERIDPYYVLPQALQDWLVMMQLRL